jgi:hypothetical protein
MTKIAYILFFLLSMFTVQAQDTLAKSSEGFEKVPYEAYVPEPEMADVFRSQGKIYVVIAVLAITFLCLIGYLIYIDIRLKKLENRK